MSKAKTISSLIFVILITGLFYYGFFIYPRINPITGRVNILSYGIECKNGGECGNIIEVDCGAEKDGPLYYVDRKSGEIISSCGGFFVGAYTRNSCPPKEWTCR